MDPIDIDLEELIALGKTQGYLTYDQVNEYLPDEAVNPDKLDSLLVALDEQGIALYSEPPEAYGGQHENHHHYPRRLENLHREKH